MGDDDRASDARSSGGLDVDGEGRARDRSDKTRAPVSAAQAASDLLASFPEGSTHCSGVKGQKTIGVERRARGSARARAVVRESRSKGVARASGVWEDEREGMVRVRLPPHGPPFEAVREMTLRMVRFLTRRSGCRF